MGCAPEAPAKVRLFYSLRVITEAWFVSVSSIVHEAATFWCASGDVGGNILFWNVASGQSHYAKRSAHDGAVVALARRGVHNFFHFMVNGGAYCCLSFAEGCLFVCVAGFDCEVMVGGNGHRCFIDRFAFACVQHDRFRERELPYLCFYEER